VDWTGHVGVGARPSWAMEGVMTSAWNGHDRDRGVVLGKKWTYVCMGN